MFDSAARQLQNCQLNASVAFHSTSLSSSVHVFGCTPLSGRYSTSQKTGQHCNNHFSPQTLDPDQSSMSDKTCRCSALSIAIRVRFNKLNLNNVVLCAEISDSWLTSSCYGIHHLNFATFFALGVCGFLPAVKFLWRRFNVYFCSGFLHG